jgi:hypothetical protein
MVEKVVGWVSSWDWVKRPSLALGRFFAEDLDEVEGGLLEAVAAGAGI